MFEQIKDAILPPAGLRDALSNWYAITEALSDTPRKRNRQTEALKPLLGQGAF
ncbi:MAG: hypothetical protein KF886_03260 [Candidatus Hydrogenedentes bacterium]|nr:hypothetical protein [Candidatus Hydrogenedentota bacterium]